MNRNSLDGLIYGSNNIMYFDSFGVEQAPKEILKNHRKEKYDHKYLQNTSIQ